MSTMTYSSRSPGIANSRVSPLVAYNGSAEHSNLNSDPQEYMLDRGSVLLGNSSVISRRRNCQEMLERILRSWTRIGYTASRDFLKQIVRICDWQHPKCRRIFRVITISRTHVNTFVGAGFISNPIPRVSYCIDQAERAHLPG